MTLIERLTQSLESDPRLPPSPGDIEEAIVEITRLKALLEDAVADFERIAAWDFDIMGDCVADAQSVARQAIRKIGEMK
jgi:hypothetical protein